MRRLFIVGAALAVGGFLGELLFASIACPIMLGVGKPPACGEPGVSILLAVWVLGVVVAAAALLVAFLGFVWRFVRARGESARPPTS